MPNLRASESVSVAVLSAGSYATVAGTDDPSGRATLNVEVVTVAGSISSSKVAWTVPPMATLVAPWAGVVVLTCGGLVSGVGGFVISAWISAALSGTS